MSEKTASERDQDRIEQYLKAHHTCLRIETGEEAHALGLVRGAVGRTGDAMWVWSATRGLYAGTCAEAEPLPDTEHAAAALYYLAHKMQERAVCVMLDIADHLGDARSLRALREVQDRFRESESCLVLIDHSDGLPEIVKAEATPLEPALPDEKELHQIVRRSLRRVHQKGKIKISLSRRDLRTVIRNLRGLTRRQAEQIIIDAVAEDRKFDAEDINTILAHKRERLQHGGVLEYVEVPVDLAAIGGLDHLKRWLKQRRNAMVEQETEEDPVLPPPRGVLLLGVQGAGKSLSAKAIAAAWQRPLLRLDPGGLYDRYIGESERRLRQALHQAEAMSPIILWVDEIEKGFASAAGQSNDGGLSQRMFGTLLTWMQEHRAPVFLIATANNIDILPPELLRKGRFDEIFFVDLPKTKTRKKIFEIHLKKRREDPASFDLARLAAASEGYSGAEIEQGIISALHQARAAGRSLETADIEATLAGSPPLSVTMAEKIARLRAWAKDRCVPAE